MTVSPQKPRILVIDDLFGRTLPNSRNFERGSLCRKFRLEDVTGDESETRSAPRIADPVAQAVFARGQQPTCSGIGDIVENDLAGTLDLIRSGWTGLQPGQLGWAMLLLDLCFYTGQVTPESDQRVAGMPEGRLGDENPGQYFGLRLLEAIHNEFPELPVVILSSKERDAVSREFSANGASGFLPRSAATSTAETLQDYLWRHGLIEDEAGHVVGRSRLLLLVLRAARRAALGNGNVLIRGERGSGKELLARYLHGVRPSRRCERPLVTVNSAVLTPDLYAGELFGVAKGAATQVEARDGLIKEADEGELFFDEIKDMVPQAQAGILRVLEDGTITPVGARNAIPVDVRFLSATNSDIESLVAAGKFRSDLLDRVRSAGTLVLPPLRERKEDIPMLVEKFVRQAEGSVQGAMIREVDPSALDRLMDHDWPGNVRELRTCIQQAVRNHQDVEYLVPLHLYLASDGTTANVIAEAPSPPARMTLLDREQSDLGPIGTGTGLDAVPLDELVSVISSYEFNATDSAALFDRLSQLEAATAVLLANYLKAVLVATSRPTQDHPEGEVFIHPAGKLMTGNSKLSASKAADLIKRLLNRAPEAIEPLMSDPLLKDAFETAQRLRPSNPKKKKSSPTP